MPEAYYHQCLDMELTFNPYSISFAGMSFTTIFHAYLCLVLWSLALCSTRGLNYYVALLGHNFMWGEAAGFISPA